MVKYQLQKHHFLSFMLVQELLLTTCPSLTLLLLLIFLLIHLREMGQRPWSPETCFSPSPGLWLVEVALLHCLDSIWGDLEAEMRITAILPLQGFSPPVFKSVGCNVEGCILGRRVP